MADEPPPVVAGVDGSEPSYAALRWAADEAVRRGAPLRLLYAVGPWAFDIPFSAAPAMVESLHEAGREILDRAAEQVRARHPHLRVTTTLGTEPPTVALCRESETAGEIVVGHRGRGGFASLLLGSVSLHTAGYASCPVVVVRDGERPERKQVVVGVDLSKHAAAALRYAFDAAVRREARLRVICAWCPPEGVYAVLEVTELAEAARQATQEIVAPWRARYPRVTVAENAPRNHPVKALVAASEDADLLVVAARGHSGVRLGSVSHGLIHHGHCPIAVVPPEGGE